MFDGIHHLLGQLYSTLTTFEEGLVHGKADTQVLAVLPDDVNLLLAVGIVTVECHDDGLSEALHIINVAVQVFQSFLQSLHIWFLDGFQGHAAMHLQSLGRSDDDYQSGLKPRLPTLDVKEFLCTEVCTEACLRHHIVGKGHGHLRGHHTRTAMGDIGKGTTVDKGWRMLCGLYKVGVQGITEQYGDSASHTEVAHSEWLSLGSDTEYDIFNTPLQVFLTRCQTEDSHQLRGWGDIEARLVHHAVAPQTSYYIPQAAVVDVEYPLPEDLTKREPFLAMLVDIVVEQGADGVMGRGHGVEIACEVQVDLLHRQYLGIATTSSTTLDAETRAERRFTQGHHRLLADLVQSQRQTDAHGGLADTRLCRTDGRHQYQPTLLHALIVDQFYWHLRHISSVGLYLFRIDTQLRGDLTNRLQLALPCYLYV